MSSPENILRLRHVTIHYGRTLALDDVTADIPCGGSTAVLGPNGAGKSTLLRAILGMQRLTRGEILIGDSHLQHARPRLAYVPQRQAIDWDFPITVRGVIRQGRYAALKLWRRFGPRDHDLVERAMAELGIGELAERQIRKLSGGQQQRVFLARALAQGGDIFLLDEPFAGLDLFACEELTHILRGWDAQGRTVVAAMHDLELVRRTFTFGVLLATGVVAAGPIGDVLSTEHIDRAYRGRCVHDPALRSGPAHDHSHDTS